MSDEKFTPGPWSRTEYADTIELWNHDAKPEFPICCIDKDGPYEANAKLILASSDLLAACQAAVHLFEQGMVDRGVKDERNWIDDTRDQIDAAVARATE